MTVIDGIENTLLYILFNRNERKWGFDNLFAKTF